MEQNGMHDKAEAEPIPQSDFVGKQEVLNQEEDPATEEQEENEEDALENSKEDAGDEKFTPVRPKVKGKKSEFFAFSQFDSSDAFNEVFGARREFDSWNEFTDFLEQFQTKSGTRYKPRSACRVDHVNERRMGSPIPERFVYAAIKMICIHYGEGGSGKRKSYVGKGCQAFMRVSFSKGAMRLTQSNLIHHNHEPTYEKDHPLARNFRVFNFTEELDREIIREVLRANPFEFKNGEKEWGQAVDRLKIRDERFSTITARLIKKRTRLLLDNFAAISQGKMPPGEDEMGTMLYKLDKAKKHDPEETPSIAKTRKRRGRGRPRKASMSEDELAYQEDNDDFVAYSPAKKSKTKQASSSVSSPPPTNSVSNGEISMLLSYLQKKDEEDRRLEHKEREEDRQLRQKEIEENRKLRQKEVEEDRSLRQKEMELRREELSFQKERFEFEKTERKAHMDLLKSQLQVFEQSMLMKQPQPQPPPPQQQATLMTLAQPLPPQPQPPLQQQQPPQQQQQQPRDNRPQTGEYNQFQYR